MKPSGLFLLFTLASFFCLPAVLSGQYPHPRLYIQDSEKKAFQESLREVAWKREYVSDLKERVDRYLRFWEKDPEWLVSRLQMNWKTRHDKVFLKAGNFSHSEGTAPVPTVRFSGTRDWATDYRTPDITEVTPYFDDPRGLYLTHKETGNKEWVHPSKSGHIIETINENIMEVVQDASFLYWLTGEEKYAAFAEPVFTRYVEGMYYRAAPEDLNKTGQQFLSGLATFEVIHEDVVVNLTVTYDFLHAYFQRKKLDQTKTVELFQRWADQIIDNGVGENNWNFFQAAYLIYLALVLEENDTYENGQGRRHYLDQIFEITTDRQIALKESILVFDQETGVWPESPSYAMHVTTSLLEIVAMLDKVTDDNEFAKYPIVEKATLALFQYLFPTGYALGFGDSDHRTVPPENFELLIANYQKYGETEKAALLAGRLQQLIDRQDYRREADDLFQLFFYVDELPLAEETNHDSENHTLVTPTFYAPGVSMFIQRMGTGKYATMVSTVGAYGNHAHANGISIELFANRYVLGPDMGRGPSYWHPDHRDYYSQFPAHNTVAVNGRSTHRTMLSFHPYTLENCYPAPGQPLSFFDKVTFSQASFVEPATQAEQQRLTGIIRSESGPAYIFDVFRSEVRDTASQKHEYFYHNLGQSLTVLDKAGQAVVLQPTDDLSTGRGDIKAYDYFREKQAVRSDEDLRALFRLSTKQENNLMQLWVKGSEGQTVYTAKGPKSRALSRGSAPDEMLDTELPTLILKREKPAWKDPFSVVFNPFPEGENAITDVQFRTLNNAAGTQQIRVTFKDRPEEDLITANTSENHFIKEDGFYQKGVLSLVRESGIPEKPDFLFVSGMYRFDYGNWQIVSIGEAATVSVEVLEEGIRVQNDKPVFVKIPRLQDKAIPSIVIFEQGKEVARRKGVVNRLNAQQIEFRLPVAVEKAMILYE